MWGIEGLELKRELVSSADQKVLRWFGHVETMDEQRMAKTVMRVTVSGGQLRGRPDLGGVMDVLYTRMPALRERWNLHSINTGTTVCTK